MDKVKSSVNRVKVKIVKKALDKVKNLDERYSWTIHFLIDLKVVYIITYAYITIVNLISSTANSEATSDANGMSLFNVTSSPEYTNIEVDSISDAILWNCRRQSVTNRYYRFLYWALIMAMSAALLGFLVTKFIALITVSCNCKNFNKYELTKLWHIAVLEELKDRIKSQSKQLNFPLKNYQALINKDIRQGIPESLKTRSRNYCRLVIPGILLWFCVVILGLSYLSYDLHPLACISQPKEELIKYNSTTKRVELEFSDELANFQTGVGITVLSLIILYLAFACLFYCLSKKVISDLKPKVEECIDGSTPARIIIANQEETQDHHNEETTDSTPADCEIIIPNREETQDHHNEETQDHHNEETQDHHNELQETTGSTPADCEIIIPYREETQDHQETTV